MDTSSGEEHLNKCGGADRFCPPGSPAPTAVAPGYYTTGGTPVRGEVREDSQTTFDEWAKMMIYYVLKRVKYTPT